jgi:hypothetical protein
LKIKNKKKIKGKKKRVELIADLEPKLRVLSLCFFKKKKRKKKRLAYFENFQIVNKDLIKKIQMDW